MEYPHLYDQPWEVHPDSETPINDLGGSDENISDKPF